MKKAEKHACTCGGYCFFCSDNSVFIAGDYGRVICFSIGGGGRGGIGGVCVFIYGSFIDKLRKMCLDCSFCPVCD